MDWRPRESAITADGAAPAWGAASSVSSSGLPEVLFKILELRGVPQEEAPSFLSPTLQSLRDPFLLKDMDRAVERLLSAHKTQESILIYGDFDLDGTSGVALLRSGLQGLGFENLSHYQPSRLTEGYGVHKAAIDQFKEQGIDLIITVDVGITDVDSLAWAKELGIDVILTDHHQPKDELPPAVAIVNPNQKECTSGLGHLCGAGVGFYLILALRKKMRELGLLEGNTFDPKDLLDVFTIATLTDLVPLVDENRVLVKHGLLALENTKRVGLKKLLEKLRMSGRPLSAGDVSISFAPKLNALSRMEKRLRPLDIYLVEDEAEADEYIEEVIDNNELRRQKQKQAEDEAFKMLELLPVEELGVAWVSSAQFHKGVVGVVANKITETYHVPAFVGAVITDEQTGETDIVGSARAPDKQTNLLAGLEAASESLTRFGGHKAAAGFQLPAASEEAVKEALQTHFQNNRNDQPKEIMYDAELEPQCVEPAFMNRYQTLEPFGMSFETPVFLLKKLTIHKVDTLRGGHLRFQFKELNRASAIWFFPPENSYVEEHTANPSMRLDVLAELQWNYFNGMKLVQLIVKSVRSSE